MGREGTPGKAVRDTKRRMGTVRSLRRASFSGEGAQLPSASWDWGRICFTSVIKRWVTPEGQRTWGHSCYICKATSKRKCVCDIFINEHGWGVSYEKRTSQLECSLKKTLEAAGETVNRASGCELLPLCSQGEVSCLWGDRSLTDRKEECPVYFCLPDFTAAHIFKPTLFPFFRPQSFRRQKYSPKAKALAPAWSIWHSQSLRNSKWKYEMSTIF